MTASGIDSSKIPTLANADSVEEHARSIRSHGSSVESATTKIDTEWKKLRTHFVSPDTETLVNALNPNLSDGDGVKTNADDAAKALEAYAKTERELAKTKATLVSDIDSFEKEVSGDSDWKKDEGKVKHQQALLDRISGLVSSHQAAERTCANAINKIYGGTQYRETAADGSAAGSGQEYYGYSRDMLNSAAGAGQAPWGKPAEWDKPWYRDLWDGAKDFGSGLWESVKGTVTGLVSLVNPFDWETFSSTWKGIGTLAVDVAVTTSPVMAAMAPDRYRESAGRLKNVGAAMLNVEEWKRNPAKAAGMLTGDVLQTVATGGAGAGLKGAATAGKVGRLAGKAGNLAGKVGDVASSLGGKLGKLGELSPVKLPNVRLRDIKLSIKNQASLAVEDVTRAGLRTLDRVTESRMAQGMKEAVLPQAQRAAAAVDRFNAYTKAGAQTLGEHFATGVSKLRPFDSGKLAFADHAPGDMTKLNSFHENYDMLMSSSHQGTGHGGGGSGHGSGSGGHGSGGERVSDDPERGIVALNRKTDWGDIQHQEFDKKVTGLDEEAKAKSAAGEPMTFEKPGERYWNKRRFLNQYPDKAYEKLPDHLKSEKLTQDWEALDKRSDLSEASLRRERRELVRTALKGYDLDHKIDLQLGGADATHNLQWLEQSVNRSVGSQLRWKIGDPGTGKFVRQTVESGAAPGTPIEGFRSN
ncbi:HNH endonuclease signature motif containing protein [Arthrobacter sp. UM1]|uniref:HNH endonuclease signature motif containing protein n=1 Tax=Arthrobacter sp. UM1 TaxID=2766776 RepID=UPI001CF6AE1A|nr:HNH endonuclease signature motif containing protein [Arthrobacter sp. UM1]MCB4208543.1 HNH endonuclease [Arthrobacter sp. UM1]